MYLTRLTLDRRNASVRRDLADAYEMHRSLVRAFVNDPDDKAPRFLWRLEPDSGRQDPIIVVQSLVQPDWSGFGSPGYLKAQVESKNIDVDRILTARGKYRFRLFANPTVTKAGKRVGLASEELQCQWLERQAAQAGFDVETALVMATEMLDVRQGDIRLRQAWFEGVLTSTDPALLKNAIKKGIGPGKAFGLGLLSISPR
ncbi:MULTISPECIES: type I-E CRISPR-associated protein Cas6/Cse3/CasE [Halomonadaceae]|jgi:CRISPR system Cascade subunit CasE|uniref:type I-E CRISPR-associated protein Cas6/Cse3/CasE n=1 Tax=Halomonadaceae TaxID=28256 RepID=UPI001C6399BC|nr:MULTISPECIES: type I-E CRISPR-associated protein Cas6/Cse3/CasE [Halomonas]MCG7590359.1 type I-E CRISPR-associated protein Cas6/Cse3/CasE [Halomonas sp. McD50-5]MCG7616471.1 type I-E CRISPR-associated protein Cas6/Cse3/CasE [Halomonas sp. McD50-4]